MCAYIYVLSCVYRKNVLENYFKHIEKCVHKLTLVSSEITKETSFLIWKSMFALHWMEVSQCTVSTRDSVAGRQVM